MGFWVCVWVAVASLVVGTIQQHWAAALIFAAVYLLGGMGVREHSTAAAICVSALYSADVVGSALVGQPPGILTIAFVLLLLANIRGTWIAAKWAKSGVDPQDLPLRFQETWRDRLVDVWPARVWPRGRYVFFPLFGLIFLLMVVGFALSGTRRTQPPHSPTFSLEVRPQNG